MLPTAHTQRRFTQFSLQWLLLIMVMATLPLAWWKKVDHERQMEELAGKEIEKLGGIVGRDKNGRVTRIDFDDMPITDEGIIHLQSLTRLEILGLNGTRITDNGLTHIKSLTNLTHLTLNRTRITDAGLSRLTGLTHLKSLYLISTPITDEGLAHLKVLEQLRTLGLNRTHITDAGLVHLEGLKQLRVVSLWFTATTPDGIRQLQTALPMCEIAYSPENAQPPGESQKRAISGPP